MLRQVAEPKPRQRLGDAFLAQLETGTCCAIHDEARTLAVDGCGGSADAPCDQFTAP
jgi:hypothetical protein